MFYTTFCLTVIIEGTVGPWRRCAMYWVIECPSSFIIFTCLYIHLYFTNWQHKLTRKEQQKQNKQNKKITKPTGEKRRKIWIWKSAQRETQTVRAGCSKAEPEIFARRRPLPGGVGWPKFNQLEMVTINLYLQTQFGEDRCTRFRVIVHGITAPQTHTQTNKPTDMTDCNTLHREG